MEDTATLSSHTSDVEEWGRLLDLVDAQKHPTVASQIRKQIDKLQTGEKFSERPATATTPTLPSQTPVPISRPPSSAPPQEEFAPLANFAFDQTSDHVKVYVTLDGVQDLPDEAVKVDFTAESFDLKIHGKQKGHRLYAKKLAHPIDPQGCRYRRRKDGVVVTLKKAKWTWWDGIHHKETVLSRGRKEEEKDAAGDPGASVMKLMKDLYQSGDDEMKRTIQKAWVEAEDKRRTGKGVDAWDDQLAA